MREIKGTEFFDEYGRPRVLVGIINAVGAVVVGGAIAYLALSVAGLL